MRYASEEVEDYDGYEYDGEEQEYGAEEDEYGNEEDEYGEEEEEQEEKVHQPTQEELDYLKLRQLLKESIRKKMKKENGTARKDSNQNNKLPYDNSYGSFFGPAQPVISQRVIQEGKSLIENQHLMSKAVSKPLNSSKDKLISSRSTSSAHKVFPKARIERESKVEKLKNTRDYSFLLSDDAELPAPPKHTPTKSVSIPSSDARPAQLSGKHKQTLTGGATAKQFHDGHDSRRPVYSSSGQVHHKPGSSNKMAYNSKQNIQQMDSRKKQLGSNNGVGPGRPMGAKPLPSKVLPTMDRISTHVLKNSTNGTKTSTHVVKNSTNVVQRSTTSKLQSAVPKQKMDHRNVSVLPSKPKMVAKQNVLPPRPQITKPLKQYPSSHPPPSQKPKKKSKMDPAILEIRKMFGYDPGRYEDGDDDDRDMEANFDDIVKEERRSAQIAAQEDEEEFRKIQEEERRERMRKMKKRKLGA